MNSKKASELEYTVADLKPKCQKQTDASEGQVEDETYTVYKNGNVDVRPV